MKFLEQKKVGELDNQANRAETLVIPQGELLPCPFCGAKPNIGTLGNDGHNWMIWCDCCMAKAEMGINGNSLDELKGKWNERQVLKIALDILAEIIKDFTSQECIGAHVFYDKLKNGQGREPQTV